MNSQHQVVIIGGGMLGVSTAYHLAQEGWHDVLLCEKGELTSGSTWHAAGLIPNFIASLNVAKIHNESIKLYKALEAKHGGTGWHGCGSLRLAVTDDEIDWMHYVAGIAKLVGFEYHLLSPSEIKEVHPLLVAEDVRLAAYTPDDGHTDPSGTCNALARDAREAGVKIVRHNRVTAIHARPGGEWEVVTEKGNVICEHVVNAAGCFGPEVGAMVGLKVPIVNMVHQYLVTENVPEVEQLDKELPVVRDPYSSSYIRQEQKSILIGPYETADSRAWALEGMDWSFDMELLPPELDRIAPWVEKALERVPCAMNSGIKRIVNGPITHTPDGNFLVGPAKGLRNFWMACGASIGICQGGGIGKYLAQWMVHGQSEINPRELDPRRFDDWAVGKHNLDKSRDEYEHMYAVHYPSEHRDAGRPVRTTPLYQTLKDKGAIFADVYGWERPKWFTTEASTSTEHYSFRRTNWFEPVMNECRAVRERVGVLELSSFAKFDVTGADAHRYLERMCANRVPARQGGIALSHMLTDDGFIETELTITRLGDNHFYLLSGAVMEQHDYDWLQQHILADEDVEVTNVTDDRGILVVTGPRSRDVLSQLTESDLSNAAFPWLTGQQIEVAGVALRALRVSYAGELGWELHHPMADMQALYSRIMDVGAAFGIADFGAYALNCLRMEKAYKGFGAELTSEVTPWEAGLERFVKLDKGDFKGRTALIEKQQQPKSMQLVYLKVDDAVHSSGSDPLGNEVVLAGEDVIGVTTSGAFGPSVEQALAFAYVKPEYAQPGTPLSVEMLGERRRATLADTPVYDSSNAKLRA